MSGLCQGTVNIICRRSKKGGYRYIMNLLFEIGDDTSPCGHALAYFTSGSAVFATYIQTFPIPMNLSQYIPPAFAALMQGEQVDGQTAAAIPPIAQPIEGGLEWLRQLATSRRDDLVNAGQLYSTDQVNLIALTQEAVALYSKLYEERHSKVPTVISSELHRYADLTEGERLREVTRLVGQLRDSLGSTDSDRIQDELSELAAGLPAKYRVEELLESAAIPGPTGQSLATLHLQRAYKLLNEEYLDVADIEKQIRELQDA